MKILYRIMGLLPVSIMIFLFCLKIYCQMILDYCKYGSELFIYNKTTNKDTIADLIKKLKEDEKEIICKLHYEIDAAALKAMTKPEDYYLEFHKALLNKIYGNH